MGLKRLSRGVKVQDNDQKLVLFPKLKAELKEKANQKFREKKFEEALEVFNHLLEYNETEHEIIFGKLLCLLELRKFESAQELCEEKLLEKSKFYFDFLNIYVTILFQTEQYELLLAQLDFEMNKEHLPPYLSEQFLYFYNQSKEMIEEGKFLEEESLVRQFKEAIKQEDTPRQIKILNEFLSKGLTIKDGVYNLLTDDQIHPLTKTKLFQCLQKGAFKQEVTISKFNQSITLRPSETPSIEEEAIYHKALRLVESKSDKDPVLRKMLEEMLYRYFYVLYPLLPEEKEVETILKAMSLILRQSLYEVKPTKKDEGLISVIKTIYKIEALYLSVME